MGLTLAEKLVAKATGRTQVSPGETLIANVDLALLHDSSGPRRVAPILKRLGARVFDPTKIVLVTDHYYPGDSPEAREILQTTRRWAVDEKVNFYDGQGICHVVLPEKGHLRPGMFVVGGDSHSPTGGAFGAYMFGIGATEMAGVLATGEIWIRVPETILLEWSGRLGELVVAKDMMLAMCGALGMDGGRYQAVEYGGEAINALSMQERMTLANMAAELGAQAGLVAPDATTKQYLTLTGVDFEDARGHWRSDPNARFAEHHRFRADQLEPQVAAPHSPANAAPVQDHGTIAINTAYIGACTGAKYVDLKAAAAMLRGRRIAKNVRLLVAPASLRDQQRAAHDGLLTTLNEAGAQLLPTACGICAGYGSHRLTDAEVCISTTARNFKGRMGSASSRVYLASPYTVAASAVAGHICDPRQLDVK